MKRVLIFSAICAAIFITGFAEAKEIYANDEIFSLINKSYDDLTSAEGALQFAGDIKRSLKCSR